MFHPYQPLVFFILVKVTETTPSNTKPLNSFTVINYLHGVFDILKIAGALISPSKSYLTEYLTFNIITTRIRCWSKTIFTFTYLIENSQIGLPSDQYCLCSILYSLPNPHLNSFKNIKKCLFYQELSFHIRKE